MTLSDELNTGRTRRFWIPAAALASVVYDRHREEVEAVEHGQHLSVEIELRSAKHVNGVSAMYLAVTLPAECTIEPPRHRVGGHDALPPHLACPAITLV